MGIWDSFSDNHKENHQEQITCPQEGETCPVCKNGKLSYNGKLELVCPYCKVVFSAGFT